MRIALSLIAFIFLGVAAAGVVPDIARRGNSSNGGHSASMSGVHSHPSGSPTGAAAHSIPSSMHSHSPAPRRADPTGTHSIHSGSPSDHPTPSAGSPSHSHSPASRRGQPTDGQSHSPASHTANPSGTHSMRASQPSGALKSGHSNLPSGASAHPSKSGSPSDASARPQPTASQA